MDPITADTLIRHGEAIDRLINEKAVQEVFQALDLIYYKQWKAAATLEDREFLRAKAVALGELKQKLEQTVQLGQDEAHRQELADAED